MSQNLGCYGDAYAITPHLDHFATQGVRYSHMFATTGVCAPARSTIITGMYPPSIGTHHMRCNGSLPIGVKAFPEYLREAGYYCTNNVKTDYNFTHSKETWDESSNKAHYRNRAPGQPFFSVFNFTSTHESQIRLSESEYRERIKDFKPAERHDPSKAPLPPYHPDTPITRQDWARYHDMITYMDKQVGEILKDLEDSGLSENTIVFYFSDHGAGMPRSKRWLYDSSTRVPLIIRFPEKYRHLAPAPPGSMISRLTSFVDLAPTILSLAGVPLPPHMQGVAFLGIQAGPDRDFVHGFRDRMDERYDLIRMVRGPRYHYIRNYRPDLPYFQHQYISYMYEMPTMKAWQAQADASSLKGAAAIWMKPTKPAEELYDTEADPWEVNNLANDPAFENILNTMRSELARWKAEIKDLGDLPEPDLRTRFGSVSPYDAVRENPGLVPFAHIADLARRVGEVRPENSEFYLKALEDSDPAIRWWGLVGLASANGRSKNVEDAVRARLEDDVAWIRTTAAETLTARGYPVVDLARLRQAMHDPNEFVRLMACNVLDRLDLEAAPARQELETALKDSNPYVVRVAEHALKELNEAKD